MSEGLLRRTHPEFPGAIGKPKAGKLARFSFVAGDGRRKMHPEAYALLGKPAAEALRKSIEGR